MNNPFSDRKRDGSHPDRYGEEKRIWFAEVAAMPEPAGPQGGDDFVGRARELSVLSAVFRQAARGDTRLALVSGEPGMGKTELARAFARSVPGDGGLVLWGSAWEDGGAPPYWPWVQVLRSYAQQAGSPALAEAAASRAAVLGPLLPELDPAGEAAGPGAAGSGPGARLTLFEAVCAVLDRISRDAPLVVILDDLHAAGRPSALLLRFAAAARLSRVLILATYRTAEAAADPEVSDVIGGLESASPPLVLPGLADEDIRLMLPAAEPELIAAIQRRGEGNPLFVSQVARLLGHGASTLDEVPVPAGIRQAVRRQLARLGAPDAAAAEQILTGRKSWLPRRRSARVSIPALVATALMVPAEPVSRLCDQATGLGLLAPRPGRRRGLPVRPRADQGDRLRRAHPPGAGPGSRQDRPGAGQHPGRSPAELAYHYLRAAPASAEAAAQAVRCSQLAGQVRWPPWPGRKAAGHFRDALDVQRRAAHATTADPGGSAGQPGRSPDQDRP